MTEATVRRNGMAPAAAATRAAAPVAREGQRWPHPDSPLGHAQMAVAHGVQRAMSYITGLGWAVIVLGLTGWACAHWLGWREFAVLAAACLAFVGVSAAFMIGRMRIQVTMDLSPQRVVVGATSMARFTVTNRSRWPLIGLGIEVPVGVAAARFTTPVLGHDGLYEDWVTIPTSRRGVVPVGPLLTQRGDPFGLLRRQLAWADRLELFIHPVTVPIGPLGTGLLRDLDGWTTQDISASDLAFHALRDYIPGDDQRFIHWKSSARVSAVAGEQRFLVRQFLDTRRSHIVVVTDVNPDSYDEDDTFETALSCGASVVTRALTEEMDLSVVCGSVRVARPVAHVALDTFSRANPEQVTLGDAVARLGNIVKDLSLAVLVTGPRAEFDQLRWARQLLPAQVRMVVIRVAPGASVALREAANFAEVTVGGLADLPRALRGEVVA